MTESGRPRFHPRNRSRLPRAAVAAALVIAALVVTSRIHAEPPPPGTIAWEPIVTPDPGVRAQMAAVYHPGRHTMIVYGGVNPVRLGDTWSLSLVPGGGWSLISPGGPVPVPLKRAMHSMVLNPLDDQLVIFGGVSGFYLNDTQVMILSGQPLWSPNPAHGTPPSARAGHAAVYDPVRQRMLVIGGFGDAGYLNDVWEYSPPGIGTWRELTPLGDPMPARTRGAAIYDPVRDRVLVIGGDDGSFRNDVWALNLSGEPVWEQIHPSGNAPSPRRDHTAIYDPVGDRVIVYGGFERGPDYPYALWLGDIWALNLSGSPSWSRLFSTTPGPANRSGHVAIYDPFVRRMVVFGGQTGASQYSSEAWSLYLGDTPTPVTVSLASTEVRSDMVRLTWFTEGAASLKTLVQRSAASSDEWTELGTPTVSGTDRLVFEDHAVTPGARYGYRLAFSAGGSQMTLEPVWVTIPQPAVLSLSGATPNPSDAGVSVRFSLPGNQPARLELFDLRGRLVVQREVGSLGPGEHQVPFADKPNLPAGVYMVRLTQDRHVLTTKACVVR